MSYSSIILLDNRLNSPETQVCAPEVGHRAGPHELHAALDFLAEVGKRLLDADISLQRVRKCLQSLTRFLPTAKRPLVELSLVVTGDVVLVFHGERAFYALTGQEWVFQIAELAAEIEQLQQDGQRPRQGELFPVLKQNLEETA